MMSFFLFLSSSLLLLSSVVSGAPSASSVGCYVPGECTLAVSVGFVSADTIADCYDYCTQTTGCNYFSHFQDEGICFTYLDCPNFGTEGCSDCISGEVSCPALQCGLTGECIGTIIGFQTPQDTVEICIDQCLAEEGCNWWTYETDGGLCAIFQDCLLPNNCETCISGQRYCQDVSLPAPDPTTLFVVGGFVGPSQAETPIVEAVDLSSSGLSCPTLTGFKAPIRDAVTLLNAAGSPVVCGGLEWGDTPSRDCTQYVPDSGIWEAITPMPETRFRAFSVEMSPGKYWITGGSVANDISATTVLYEFGFATGPDMPVDLEDHCMAKVDEDTYILAGGSNYQGASQLVFKYDVPSATWTQLANMTLTRTKLGCGVARNNGVSVFVAVGGDGRPNTEILDLDTGTWRAGPHITSDLSYMESVPFGDTFLLIGGRNQDTTLSYKDIIYEYDPLQVGWILRSETLGEEKAGMTAILVAKDVVSCV